MQKTSSFRRFVVLPAVLVLAAACVSTPPPSPVPCCDAPWGYEAPEHWADLSPCYAECRNGGEQSPIDIVNPQRAELPAVDFSGYGTVPDLVARHDGHTIRIDVPKPKADSDPPVAWLKLGGVTYRLDQFHFHTPSEHRVRGNDRPIEIHFVNISPGGRVVAVGVFIKDGPSNPELAKIWKDLPPKGESRPVGTLDLGHLLPPRSERTSYRYSGSLTNPPCGQGYQWIVYSQPLTLAAEEIGKLQAIFSGKEFPEGNRRRPQPLNGRIVLTDVPRL
ncbi:MAG TPA: carbonic anhydrase family protein [Thermoanaerobaculia bacterium]|nr:carbonic anhydrase family protein [Thermoanaerobaculia bacterium]